MSQGEIWKQGKRSWREEWPCHTVPLSASLFPVGEPNYFGLKEAPLCSFKYFPPRLGMGSLFDALGENGTLVFPAMVYKLVSVGGMWQWAPISGELINIHATDCQSSAIIPAYIFLHNLTDSAQFKNTVQCREEHNSHIIVPLSFSGVWLFATPWTAAPGLSCPSLSPGACSNSCPLSQWCHSSHTLSSPSLITSLDIPIEETKELCMVLSSPKWSRDVNSFGQSR